MRVRETLLVEGTSKFAVLCYGIFPSGELEVAFETLRSREDSSCSGVHKFLGDGWPNGLILNEARIANQEAILCTITEAVVRMFEVGTCLASVCMYDGAFGSYDDIFASETASQTYAFSFSEGELVIALDASVLKSGGWASIIAQARKRLG